ncbi:hypothetical protein Taro_013519 [Colocasia esculenta]|uniref:Uncharacterized protein n=1 Tax=Colocasia esculenta TaxID=4460 RepID=A0A843UC91_COLES|nr:hypothetical protein [Colocasia esculenta]
MAQPNSTDKRGPPTRRHVFSRNSFKVPSPVLAFGYQRDPRAASGYLIACSVKRPFLPSRVCSAYVGNLFRTDGTSSHQASGSKPRLQAPSAEQWTRLPSNRSGSPSRLPARYLPPRRVQEALHPLVAVVTATPCAPHDQSASTRNSPAKGANGRALCGIDQGRSVPLPQHFCL